MLPRWERKNMPTEQESLRGECRSLTRLKVQLPLHPDLSGQVGADVVPGAYDNWHYDALAMYCALREIATQKEKIEQLTKRVKLLEQMAFEDD